MKQHHEHLEWLVSSRIDAQKFLLELYKYVTSTNGREHLENRSFRQFIGLMQGAGVALWRASFLIEEQKNDKKILDKHIYGDATEFLRHLVRNNMIGYIQDTKGSLWTSRYYINNTVFRLIFLGKRFKYASTSNVLDYSIRHEATLLDNSRNELRELSDKYLGWNDKVDAPKSKDMWNESMKLLKEYFTFVKTYPEAICKSVDELNYMNSPDTECKNQEVARLVPGPTHQTALEAMADVYGTLPEDAAAGWITDSREGANGQLDEELRDPWGT